MALDNTVATSAPTAAPVAPDVPSGPAPDLSALTQPGGQAQPSQAVAVQNSMAPYQAAEQSAIQKAADIANQPAAVPATGPHSRLISMVQGLALGADAFGKSIATHGREGGVEEVQQVQQQQQQQKIQAQQAAEAQKNQQIQQQLMVADTNHKLGQNILLMATLPTDLALNDLKLPAAQASLVAGKAEAAKTQAEFISQYGLSTDAFNNMLSGNPAAVDPQAAKNLNAFASQKLSAAGKILPANDPVLATAQQTIANPKATPQDIFGAVSSVNRQLGLQQQISDAKTKKEAADANSPVAKLSTPEALAAPGAQASIQAKIDDPNTDPNDIPRLRKLLPAAAVAQFNAENIKQREARNTQVISQGDPDAAGKLLANRSLTIEELKSRQVTPQFIVNAIQAAQKYDPTYRAAEASGQARIAGAPANQQFFGNTDSLLVKGGTLDQLQAKANALPNGKIPVFNKVTNLVSEASGKGPTAAYAASVLGVADDYSKVMGVGSDTAREQVMERLNRAQSPEQATAVVNQFRQQIQSQRDGRLGTNPYLRDMYPNPTQGQAAGPAGVTGKARAADGNWYYHDAQGNNLGRVQ
jgi:hypothetical protein